MIYKRILISQQQIQTAVQRLAAQISDYYAGRPFVALTLLEGARYFARDLQKHMSVPFEQQCLKVSSYHGTTSGDSVTLQLNPDIRDQFYHKDMLIIDDIYDTGKTLSRLLEWLKTCHPADIKTCVLLEKQMPHIHSIPIDFLGMTVENVFVIGYGMDFNGRCRELPFIAELDAESIEE